MATTRRRRWLWLIAFALLLPGGWLLLRHLLQPQRLSDFLLQQAREATGLELRLAAPADVGFWPDLHLELEGLVAKLPGDDAVVLQAEAVDVVLPWSALRAEAIELRSLRLQAPVLDLGALSRWLASRQQDGPPAPFRLPQVDAAISVAAGRIQGEDWAVSSLALELPFLRAGQASAVGASGAFEYGARAPVPFSAAFDFIPGRDGNELRMAPLALALHVVPADAPWLRVEGSAALQPPVGLQLDLVANLPQWPADWPALPLPDAADADAVRIDFDYRGDTGLQGQVAMRLARGDAGIEAELRLGDVPGWIGQADANLLPPLRGEVRADRLEAAGVELRGVSVRIDDGAPAAQAGDGD